MKIDNLDLILIRYCKKIFIPLARFGLFIVFFWFGILKVIGLSPASPLVKSLFEAMFPIIPFSLFIVLFGLLEVIIGILFLIPRAERMVIPIMFFHMVTTILPLFLLTDVTWSGFLTPTLEGQYIIKNVVLVACAIGIAAHLHPMHHTPDKAKFQKYGRQK
jgi:uncharacterized membrane protein YkgB